MSKGLAVLSHGLESGPTATKVTALAAVCEELGWDSVRPNYLDLDALKDPLRIADRIERMLAHAEGHARVVLAGSSMGAFISALGSLEREVAGVFLIAPPIAIDGFERRLDVDEVPLSIVHGWDDELIPYEEVVAFAHARRASLLMLDDDHRLANQVPEVAAAFRRFLLSLD
jgi:pimeloyl-ACP methyl ester carboxylesterase